MFEQISSEIKRWIDGAVVFSDIPTDMQKEIIELLFKEYKINNEERDFVIMVLNLTEEPKLIEVAKKMEMFNQNFSTKDSEEMELTRLFLESHIGVSGDFSVGRTFQKNGKVYTLAKEIKEIKKRYKQVRKYENKRQIKFKNISNISTINLYDELISCLREASKSNLSHEYIKQNIKKLIYTYHYEVVSMFSHSKELEFIRKQKSGKIK